ncbi:unknown [Clostridium sp. CAG:510]|nr:unknown [Clostridium sp. CAG:510]
MMYFNFFVKFASDYNVCYIVGMTEGGNENGSRYGRS